MCLKCRLYGSMANISDAGDIVSFQEEELRKIAGYSYVPKDIDDLSVLESCVDRKAETFLRPSLDVLEHHGLKLRPFSVSTDGSCLPHAISYCLVGKEYLYDALRSALHMELLENKQWYRENTDLKTRDGDVNFERDFSVILDAAKPTRGLYVGEDKFLEYYHIIALANVLRRPILLADIRQMAESQDAGDLFPPMRHTREQIIEFHGFVPPAIAIGWQDSNRRHYVPLINVAEIDLLKEELQKQKLYNDNFQEVVMQTAASIKQGLQVGDRSRILVVEDMMRELVGDMKRQLDVDIASSQFRFCPILRLVFEIVDAEEFRAELSTDKCEMILQVFTKFLQCNSPIAVFHSAHLLKRYITHLESSPIVCLDKNDLEFRFGITNVISATKVLELCDFRLLQTADGKANRYVGEGYFGGNNPRRCIIRLLDAVVHNESLLQVAGQQDFPMSICASLVKKPDILGQLIVDEGSLTVQSGLPLSSDIISKLPNEMWLGLMIDKYGGGSMAEGSCLSISNAHNYNSSVRLDMYLKFKIRYESLVVSSFEPKMQLCLEDMFQCFSFLHCQSAVCRKSERLVMIPMSDIYQMEYCFVCDGPDQCPTTCITCSAPLNLSDTTYVRVFDRILRLFNESFVRRGSSRLKRTNSDSAEGSSILDSAEESPNSPRLAKEFSIGVKASRTVLRHTNRNMKKARQFLDKIQSCLSSMTSILETSQDDDVEARCAEVLMEAAKHTDDQDELLEDAFNMYGNSTTTAGGAGGGGSKDGGASSMSYTNTFIDAPTETSSKSAIDFTAATMSNDWTCINCTLINTCNHTTCTMCGAPK